ncbi:thioesterase family protein [Segetibacter sp.]|jgi:acyl-CoA thioester hydrolase|uniref:acyl-CoA thioesterase n=1 Tax=Segetibacter sp. TaxID=2231182 RepID=UPI0026322E0E|nr:thioesterase family protein [Segetibacter sp.]MCW3080474.1 thioesterase [Segetibacter sp.]
MERIKVSLPHKFNFSTILKIRITDLNYGGHVGNDVFLSLVHEARQQYLQHFGYTELNLEGAGLIMADAAIEYKRELKYGDEIQISVAASGIDRLGFDIFYKIEVKPGDEWLVAGKVKTGMLCFDYTTKKKISVPEKAVEKMGFL